MAYSKMAVGREVRISQRTLEGLVRIVQRPPGAKGRIRVLLGLLNRQSSKDTRQSYRQWTYRPWMDGVW